MKQKIEIDESLSDSDYGDIAFLVDKRAFLSAIEGLREKWEITTLYSPDKYSDWLDELERRRLALTPQEIEQQITALETGRFEAQEEYDEAVERIKNPTIGFDCDVRDLRLRFNRLDTFDRVIARAIVCGRITKGVYEPTYWEIDTSHYPLRLGGITMRVGIFITPSTQKRDLLKKWSEAKEAFKQSKDDRWHYEIPHKVYGRDVRGKVKKVRYWYWRYHEGTISYRDIAIDEYGGIDLFRAAKKTEKHQLRTAESEREKHLDHLDLIDEVTKKIERAIERYNEVLTDI